MLGMSAPSANTLTFNSDTDFGISSGLLQTGVHDPVGGFAQRTHGGFRRLSGLSLAVAVVNQNRFATCAVAGIDVAPTISYYETAREIDIVLSLGLKEQAGLWFAAGAIISIVMITDEDVVDG